MGNLGVRWSTDRLHAQKEGKMLKATVKKAENIIRDDRIRLLKDSVFPYFLHFKITNKEDQKIDVWRRTDKNNIFQWSCNRLVDTNGRKWGCVMFTGDKTNPFCSHTLAAQVYLDTLFGNEE